MTNSVRIKKEILDSSPEEISTEQVLDLRKSSNSEKSCTWCGKQQGEFQEKGVHNDFCSSVCFDLFRRDSFKKRASCIWCSSGSTVQNNLAVNGATVDESKFCSQQCLTQFKVRVFCVECSAAQETSAHLDQLKDVNHEGMKGNHVGNDLITPELWLKKTTTNKSRSSVVVTENNSGDSHFTGQFLGDQSHSSPSMIVTSLSRPISTSSSSSQVRSTLATTTVDTPTASPMMTSPGSGPPLRKRGRVSKSTAVPISNPQRSPSGENYSNCFHPNNLNLMNSVMLNFPSSSITNNSNGDKESHRPRDFQRLRANAINSVNNIPIRQIPVSSFPRLPPSSSLINNAFPNFPFPPPSHQERFNRENIFRVTKVDVGVNTIISNENCNLDSKWLAMMNKSSSSVSKSQSEDKNETRESSGRGGNSSKINNLVTNSFPPITMVFPIPLPIPIPFPIPIPIILNSIQRDSKKAPSTTTHQENIPGIDPNDNNNTIVIPNHESPDNGRRGKLKRGHIIDIEEND